MFWHFSVKTLLGVCCCLHTPMTLASGGGGEESDLPSCGPSDSFCDLVSTLCKYDLRKGDLFVLSWAMVR